ncbi:sensor histidine kinase [Streptomyces sp. NPDC018019]|uniref:sensor histidine kinase n=1 Tax=Streptomyces sp. NPDC018019 TaxID=3365030 RepID=UPI0037BCECAC
MLDDFGALAFAVCPLALLALPLRRRITVTAFCATLPAIFTGHLLLPSVISMYVVALQRPQKRLIGFCVLMFAATLCTWPLWVIAEMTRAQLLNTIEAAALLTIGPTALGLLARARAETQAQLVQLEASRARDQRREAERAVIRERARLARDMHDTVSHHVSIIAVQLGALWSEERDPGKRVELESVRMHSVRALEELRDMVGVLRSSDADIAAAAGRQGLDDVPRLVADSGLDVTVELSVPAEHSWPPGVEATAYRIVQEALSNVRKHAPGAPVALSARLGEDRKSLVLEVRNGPVAHRQSVGLWPAGGHGLAGARERAQQVGGRLTAAHSTDGGFLVRAVLPGPCPGEAGASSTWRGTPGGTGTPGCPR